MTSIREAYPHGCLKIVKHDTNVGLAGSRNTGVMASTGDFLLPLDQDDLLDSTFIEKKVPLLSVPLVDWIYSQVQLFGDRTDLWCPDITLTNLMANLQTNLNNSKKEYAKPEKGFKDLQQGYYELLERYNDSVSEFQKLSLLHRALSVIDRISASFNKFRN